MVLIFLMMILIVLYLIMVRYVPFFDGILVDSCFMDFFSSQVFSM